MDPVTAFALATGIMTAIEFSIKGVKEAHHIVNSATNTSAEAARLEAHVNSILTFCEDLEKTNKNAMASTTVGTSPSIPTVTNDALNASILRCQETARKLLSLLQDLKLDKTRPLVVRKS